MPPPDDDPGKDDSAKGSSTLTRLRRALPGGKALRGDRAFILDTVGTIGLNVSAVALNFGLVLLLSHLLGPSGFGAYASAYAWTGILAVVAVLGLTPLVIRHTVAYHAAGSRELLRGLLHRTNQAVLIASAITVGAAAIGGWLLYRGRPELLTPFLVGLVLVPLVALTSLRQAAMQGLGRVVLGRLPETVIGPAVTIVLVALAYAALGHRFDAVWAISLQAAAVAGSFLLGALLLRRTLGSEVRKAPPRYETASWLRSALPLFMLNVLMAANAQVGTILLGVIDEPKAAGVFNVAFRVTIFISFVMLAASYPLSPRVARLHVEGDRLRTEQTVIRAARLVLLVSIPVAVVLVAFTPQVLSVFGSGFEGGVAAVRIMAIGDLVNVLTGFGGLVLVMSGREFDLMVSAGAGSILNIALSAALIGPFGIEGAAIGVAAGLTATNLCATWYAWRKLGVWAPVLWRPHHGSPLAAR